MGIDPRSLERLRQLGRSLPQPLPAPAPPTPAPASSRGRATEPRHKLETETDPDELFRDLMQASADGTVPPHLVERLRQLEADRRAARATPAAQPPQAAASAPAPRRGSGLGRPDPKLAAAHGNLYTAFQQLLLEEEELD
jgi:hypothetical protein